MGEFCLYLFVIHSINPLKFKPFEYGMNKKYSNNIEEMLVKGVLSLFMITLNINLLYTHLN